MHIGRFMIGVCMSLACGAALTQATIERLLQVEAGHPDAEAMADLARYESSLASHGPSWELNEDDDEEYYVYFAEANGNGWMLSCGTWVGPAVMGAGLHRFVGESPVTKPGVTHWGYLDVSSVGSRVIGEWLYGMLHGSALPSPFNELTRPALANFEEAWRVLAHNQVCTSWVQAYRAILARVAGYPAALLELGWGTLDESVADTLIYRELRTNGASPSDFTQVRVSCTDGVDIYRSAWDWQELVVKTYVYRAQGWEEGDEGVVQAMLRGEDLPPGMPLSEWLGEYWDLWPVPAGDVGSEGLQLAWPRFAARCSSVPNGD